MTSSIAPAIRELCVAWEMHLARESRLRAAAGHNAHKFPLAEVIAAPRWATDEC